MVLVLFIIKFLNGGIYLYVIALSYGGGVRKKREDESFCELIKNRMAYLTNH
jgi:hypothetical protein